MSSKETAWWRRRFLLLLAILSTVIGLILIILPSIVNLNDVWGVVLRSVGVALITAVLLGSTIEWIFRQRLFEDVFKASIGYILPNELKAELGALYNQEILCVKHSQRFSLYPVLGHPELVILRSKIERDLKNISNKDYSFCQTTSLFEWFHSEAKSRIVDMGCIVKDVRITTPHLRIATCQNEPTNRIEATVDTHGQARGTLIIQALLDALRARSHSPTGNPVELCPSGY